MILNRGAGDQGKVRTSRCGVPARVQRAERAWPGARLPGSLPSPDITRAVPAASFDAFALLHNIPGLAVFQNCSLTFGHEQWMPNSATHTTRLEHG